MRYLSSFPRLNTVIILLFFAAWFWTEIQENRAAVEWKAFIREGSRFTMEQGEALEARIKVLEDEISEQ